MGWCSSLARVAGWEGSVLEQATSSAHIREQGGDMAMRLEKLLETKSRCGEDGYCTNCLDGSSTPLPDEAIGRWSSWRQRAGIYDLRTRSRGIYAD